MLQWLKKELPKKIIGYSKHIPTCLMKSGKREARVVKADYGCVNSNTPILEYLTTIQRGIRPRIKADY